VGLGAGVVGGGGALCVAFTVDTVTDELFAVSMKTRIATPAITATPTAPTTATAERKLVSSIQALSVARIRPARFTTQHDTAINPHL
jgi:hypothetical protein